MSAEIIIDNKMSVKADSIPQLALQRIESKLIFVNPQWLENEKRGRWNGKTPEKLNFIVKVGDRLIMPRGFVNELRQILKSARVEHQIVDLTKKKPESELTFHGVLHQFQVDAVNAVIARRYGVLNAPTGSGKTVMALYVVAHRKQPTLVVTHTKELMYQWRERAIEFLGIPQQEIGLFGDGHKDVGAQFTVAIINSLYKSIDDVKDKIGFLIVDECHRTPARTFIEAVAAFDSYYMLGLSATPYRRDDLTNVIYFYLGDMVYNISPQLLQKQNKIMIATLCVNKTSFDYPYEDDYTDMITELTNNYDRNKQIVEDVSRVVRDEPGIALVISERKSHCVALYNMIKARKLPATLLTGDTGNSERKSIVQELQEGNIKVLVASSRLIGEGFDLKSLSSIFLATPVTFSGRVKQYIGRILRKAHDKKNAFIFDYLDRPGVLQASFNNRINTYRELGVDLYTEHKNHKSCGSFKFSVD